MEIRSLGISTELALAAGRNQIIDRGDYLVVLTPDDPSYYYGNLLMLPAAPQVGEVAHWVQTFHAELGGNPEIRHVTLAWDGIHGDVGAEAELVAARFTIERAQVMTAREVRAAPIPFEVRRLSAEELPRAAELAFAIEARHDEAHRRFLQRRNTWHRSLVARGVARFFGAFDNGALIGSLGLVSLGRRARYQDVQTAATHRGRGVASALLAAAASEALAVGPKMEGGGPKMEGGGLAPTPGIDEVVIVATPGSAAARVYERVGFATVERIASACRYPGAAER